MKSLNKTRLTLSALLVFTWLILSPACKTPAYNGSGKPTLTNVRISDGFSSPMYGGYGGYGGGYYYRPPIYNPPH